jgi:hypothetical protein
MHLLAEHFVFGDDRRGLLKEGVNFYRMAPTSPLNSPTVYLCIYILCLQKPTEPFKWVWLPMLIDVLMYHSSTNHYMNICLLKHLTIVHSKIATSKQNFATITHIRQQSSSSSSWSDMECLVASALLAVMKWRIIDSWEIVNHRWRVKRRTRAALRTTRNHRPSLCYFLVVYTHHFGQTLLCSSTTRRVAIISNVTHTTWSSTFIKKLLRSYSNVLSHFINNGTSHNWHDNSSFRIYGDMLFSYIACTDESHLARILHHAIIESFFSAPFVL